MSSRGRITLHTQQSIQRITHRVASTVCSFKSIQIWFATEIGKQQKSLACICLDNLRHIYANFCQQAGNFNEWFRIFFIGWRVHDNQTVDRATRI